MTAATTRREIAGRARRLAKETEDTHPTMGAHNHLRDAAQALESGNTEGAQRHLRAAANLFTPQNLTRFGHLEDDTHMAGKQHMHNAHRLILQVKDAEDTRQREEQQAAAKRAMNAPAHQGLGRPDGTAKGPSAPIGEAPYKRLPARSWIKEGAESAGPKLLSNSVELVGPKGFEHGWHYVGTNTPHAAGYHGMQVAGQTKTSRVFGTYDHTKREVVTPEGYRRHVTHIASLRQGGMGDQAPLRGTILSNTTDLSAQTARLAATPAPRGRPGGPGLYDVAGMGHTDYLQQIVKALIEKRGMDPGKAYAIARGAIRKWARGGGHVHPEVQAAAGTAEAGELARQARAKAVHGHSNTGGAIEMSSQRTIELFNPNHGPNGQFTTPQNAQHPKGKQLGKPGKTGHGRGFLPQKRAKGQLLARAHADQQKANALRAQLRALLASMRSGGSGKTSAAGGASKTSASASKAAAGKTSTSGASSKPGSSSSSRTSPGRAAMQARVSQLRSQIHALESQARQLRAQAAKL